MSLLESKPEGLQLYPYKTLAKATNDFHPENKTGISDRGAVYKVLQVTQELHRLWRKKS